MKTWLGGSDPAMVTKQGYEARTPMSQHRLMFRQGQLHHEPLLHDEGEEDFRHHHSGDLRAFFKKKETLHDPKGEEAWDVFQV